MHNLPWTCTWQQLKDAFTDAGVQNVERADVIIDSAGRSRSASAAAALGLGGVVAPHYATPEKYLKMMMMNVLRHALTMSMFHNKPSCGSCRLPACCDAEQPRPSATVGAGASAWCPSPLRQTQTMRLKGRTAWRSAGAP